MNKLEDLENEMISHIKNMEERKLLKEIENQVFSNDECLNLISQFQNAQNEYNFALKIFKDDQKIIQLRQKELHQAKLKMDSHYLISEYNNLLIKCNEPLRYLEYKLFSLFQKGKKEC